MNNTTREKILKLTTKLFARSGYEGFSMRILASEIPLAQSVIYHYFSDKDTLLKTMFNELNLSLGQKRALLKPCNSTSEMMMKRILFQLDNSEKIVAVLKYYLAYRNIFAKFEGGFVPDKSSRHIEEVLEYGVGIGDIHTTDIKRDAKVITHAINGYLLEYFPLIPKGKEKIKLAQDIHQFIMKALLKGGEKNEKFISN